MQNYTTSSDPKILQDHPEITAVIKKQGKSIPAFKSLLHFRAQF
jgi:hypothetical protein